MKQGHCLFPTDDSGRILDRLAGLEQVIRPEAVRQALHDTGRINPRACRLTHEVMLWVVLAMGVLTHLPIRQVFKHARRLRYGEETPDRSSLCQARRRLGIEPVQHLFEHTVGLLGRPEMPGAFYQGLRWMGIDGTVLDVPDTVANDVGFGRPTGGNRGPGAFPQVRKLSLVELGTHVEVAFVASSLVVGEQALVDFLIEHLPPDALLLEDRGFFSYAQWKRLDGRGVRLLVRVSKQLILEPFRRLSDGSYLAKIYPSSSDRDKDRHGIVVRVIRYTLNDPQRVGHQEVHTLMTNLLDEVQYPAGELIPGYHERWEEELVYDEQKTHQDPPRPSKPVHLRSETPAGVIQELYALSLAHFVVRAMMVAAAEQVHRDPDRLSFTGCLHILQCRLPECDSATAASFAAWCQALLWEMSYELTDPRRNRINPRVIKQKMSKWKKKRPEHRHLPPLKKTFTESVVMVI